MPPSLKRRVTACLVAGVTAAAVTAVAQTASATPQPHAVPDSVPKWTAQAHTLGNAASSQQVNFGVVLKLHNAPDALATLQRISDPDSSSYGQWLTNQQFNARYAPSSSDVAAVRNWLTAQGFTLRKTLPSGMYVEASGSVA